MQYFPLFVVQPSVLGSGIQTISSSNAMWKTNSLGVESVSRQRSSSDPPAIHPPVPPLRVTSTSMFPLSSVLPSIVSNHSWLIFPFPQLILPLLVTVALAYRSHPVTNCLLWCSSEDCMVSYRVSRKHWARALIILYIDTYIYSFSAAFLTSCKGECYV